MKINIYRLIIIALLSAVINPLSAQKNISYADVITSDDLESHISFLASPLLKGRMNGEPELEIAQQYIVSQAKLMELKPVNGNSYYQSYSITRSSIDLDRTSVKVISNEKDTVTIKKPVYQLVPSGPSDFTFDGEVVFAGYGLKLDKHGYNDFEDIETEGKILLVMNRAPSTEDGEKFLFEETQWSSFMSIQVKLPFLIFSRAKAVIFIMDPKSGFSSLEEPNPGYASVLNSTQTLKGEEPRIFELPGMPKVIFVHRSVADELLKGSGYTLEELQNKIDTSLKPQSFELKDKKIMFTEKVKNEDIKLNNIAACIEGSDPELKKEYVIFSCHVDHIGESAKGINAGADDNASGCAAVLSLAKAFQSLNKKPLRSAIFLWVSGEEIGLFGSKSYVDNPLVPLENTLIDLNMDMIGRVKGVADTSADNPMTGPTGVFVITGNQSSELMAIADEIDKGTILDFDYSLSGRKHPLQLFARSDHYNFVRHDIPVLFFTTGLHTDYHTPGDVIEKIDFKKLELITETVFQLGYAVANRKTRPEVDNPFSSW